MSDATYRIVRLIGVPAFRVSASPIVLNHGRVPPRGALILAPNHLSHYDVPCLMAETRRNIDFVSVAEFLKVPWVGLLFRGMNCMFLDRGRADPATVKAAVDRLRRGRMVAMFPEGRIRDWEESVVHGHPFKPGVVRIAQLANAPIVPCVVLGTAAYRRTSSWHPHRAIRYGINYGEPMRVRTDLEPEAARAEFTERLAAAYVSLYRELRRAMPPGARPQEPAPRRTPP